MIPTTFKRPIPQLSVPAAMVLVMSLVVGCQPSHAAKLEVANSAYLQGNYRAAYDEAVLVARTGGGSQVEQAMYLAGLSAYQLGEHASASYYLQQASQSRNPALKGDSLAALGLSEALLNRYDSAAKAFLASAEILTGEQRANAYYQAAMSQQKLGQWSQARTTLILARNSSKDPAFIAQATEQLKTTGFTLQAGAFADRGNAERAAGGLGLRAESLRIGQPRIVETLDATGKFLYLVQIGQFTTYASAAHSRDRIGPGSAIIVPLSTAARGR